MKKPNSNNWTPKNALRHIYTSLILIGCLVLLSGCTTFQYSGNDYDATKSALIQSEEGFNFYSYTKSSPEESIDFTTGISITPLDEALVVYVNILNKTSEDYLFYLKDLHISSNAGSIDFINPAQYIDAYQSHETGAYAGMSSIAPTIGAIANLQNSYNQTTQASQVAQQQNAAGTISGQIAAVANGISKHTINSAALIAPKSSDYFYIFIKNPNEYPINIQYKDLNYSFGESQNK